MDVDDGRVISNFINQAIREEPLTVYGDGSQTRSFCYIDDLIDAIECVLQLNTLASPVNLGNSQEISLNTLIEEIEAVSGKTLKRNFSSLPPDDPLQRNPDLTFIKQLCSWEPQVTLSMGITRTFEYFRSLNT
jgi:nucleoside-diphosphate-sugar epimerase